LKKVVDRYINRERWCDWLYK